MIEARSIERVCACVCLKGSQWIAPSSVQAALKAFVMLSPSLRP